MANRYTKTGFTARQIKTLQSIRYDLVRIQDDRMGKNDSDRALALLNKAEMLIMIAIDESKQHKARAK